MDDATEDTRSWNTVEVSGDSTTDESGVTTTTIDTSDIKDGDSIELTETDNNDVTNLDLSDVDGAVKVTLPKTGTFNITTSDADGSRVVIPEDFEGTANITTGDGSTMVIAKASENGTVNIKGGSGDDTYVVEGANVDLSGGGSDVVYGWGNFSGYDENSDVSFRVGVDNVYDAIENGDIVFGNGYISVEGAGGAINLDADAGNVGTLKTNLTDAYGNTNRVENSYTGGGTMDNSESSDPMILVGNSDGLKSGSTNVTSGTGNDSLITGAGDVVANAGGTDDINIKHTRDGGVTFNQMTNPARRATNNISNYSSLFDFIRQGIEAFAATTARFVNGQLQTKHGNITNNFSAGRFRDLAELEVIENTDVFEDANVTVKVDTTEATTTVRLTNDDSVVIDANGYEGDAILIGNDNDNVIYGGSGNNSLWGGASGDDTLFGGDGYNEYYYLKGNGDDVINDAKDGDVIKLLDISIEDINARFTEVSEDKVVVSMQDGGSLTLNGKADVTFELNDGTKFGADRKNKGFNRK